MAGRGLILAAPASGSGKTLIAAALLRYLRRRGVRVAAAKAGPDYIDPTFHAAASGTPCINLDPWAMRPATLAGLVAELEARADLVLCEGVMGLFDGTGPDGEAGSTAELARLTGWPVVLVVDARRQGASAAALIGGFVRHDPRLPLSGVVFNRVALNGVPGACTANSCPNDAFSNPSARILLMSAAGGAPIDLAAINGTGALTNSWPRFAPNRSISGRNPARRISFPSKNSKVRSKKPRTVGPLQRTPRCGGLSPVCLRF